MNGIFVLDDYNVLDDGHYYWRLFLDLKHMHCLDCENCCSLDGHGGYEVHDYSFEHCAVGVK